jgi:hypothetical protein
MEHLSISKEIVNKKMNKLSRIHKVLLYMNVETNKENYAQYRTFHTIIKQNISIVKNQSDMMVDARRRVGDPIVPSPPKSTDHKSTSTIPYDE